MRRVFLVLTAAFLAASGPARVRAAEEDQRSGLSRQMRNAIRFYEAGDDMQAMDRFMDILTKGDPNERAAANEYINLITHRMNSGGADFKPAPKSAAAEDEKPRASRPAVDMDVDPAPRRAPAAIETEAVASAAPAAPPRVMPSAPAPVRSAPEVVVEAESASAASAPRAERAMPAAPLRPSRSDDAPLPGANKALMKKEIKAKIRAGLETALRQIKETPDVRVLMMENGDPKAIGIPSSFLFSSGISFRKEAGKLLDSLTRLVVSLGSTKVIILPEGAAIGDAKVLDMRRTMGISAHLFGAGVAPPRVKVNLISAQVDIPKAIADFKGIVILFVYNEPLTLTVDSALGDEGGPPLSLGVNPPAFRPERGEGAVIELSVSDPPVGLVSWKFQLLRPTGPGGDLEPLQEIVGGGPVFHQIYWNGRQNYFGQILPPGRYECVLTATDAKNRQKTLHRWIQLLEPAGLKAIQSAPATAAAAAPSAASAPVVAEPVARGGGAPSADLAADKGASSLLKESAPKAKAGGRKPRRAAAKKAAAQPAAEAAPAAAEEPAPAEAAAAPKASPAPAKAGKPASFELTFQKDTHKLTPEGEKRLAKIAETAQYYPLENIKLVAYAGGDERDANFLAESRGKMIAGLLLNRYQIEPKKISYISKVVAEPAYRVEAYFTGGE